MTMNLGTDKRAVILCSHVANGKLPILYAERSEPIEDTDSGWQCLCYSGLAEDPDAAKVCSVHELLHLEPSLVPYVDSPPGTRLVRTSAADAWHIYQE